MKRITSIAAIFISFLFFSPCALADRSSPLIIDHTCLDLSQIPANWIEQAKSQIKWHYAHTSHGEQLTSGLQIIKGQDSTFNSSIGTSGLPTTSGALCILDGMRPYADDTYITPNEYFSDNWQTPYHAHNLLNSSGYAGVINVSAFSWCTQMTYSGYESLVDDYLQAMTQLEEDNPGVTFVYLTGNAQCGPDNHYCTDLDGGYRRYIRNEQIREYCRNNNKVLFDFADIDSWWYNTDTSQWEQFTYEYIVGVQTVYVPYEHPHYNLNQSAHTSNENCENKGKAVWHLMARLAGWGDCIEAPSDLNAQADSANQQIVLSWTDNSTDTDEDSFIIQRQVDDGAWDNGYASVGANITTYMDSGLATGSYQYRVVAHLDDDGEGNPCDSGTSNVVEAQIESTEPPEAPTDLSAIPDSQNRQINLSWTDNATNESGFRIQRQRGSDAWVVDYATVGENVSQFSDTQLDPGEYTYRVEAYNANDYSDATDPVTAVILDLPEAPGGLTAQANSDNGTITLNWTDHAENETGFVIQRRVNDGAWDDLYDQTTADTSEYVDTNKGAGPLADGTYTYRVAAVNDNGQSNPSNEAVDVISTIDDPDSDGDGVPDSEDGCPADGDKTAPGACGCGTPDADSDDDGTPDCNDECPDDPDKIDPGQCGCGVPETDSCNLSPRPPVLIAPVDASSDTSLTPSLSAGDFQDPDSEDTHGQTIWQISTNRDFSEPVLNETSDAHLTTFIVPDPLTAETTYYWRVCYIDNRGAQSEWSDPFSFTTAAQDQLPDEIPEDEDDNNDGGNGSDGDGFPGCFIGVADRKR